MKKLIKLLTIAGLVAGIGIFTLDLNRYQVFHLEIEATEFIFNLADEFGITDLICKMKGHFGDKYQVMK